MKLSRMILIYGVCDLKVVKWMQKLDFFIDKIST